VQGVHGMNGDPNTHVSPEVRQMVIGGPKLADIKCRGYAREVRKTRFILYF
jgi:hypothetical protein